MWGKAIDIISCAVVSKWLASGAGMRLASLPESRVEDTFMALALFTDVDLLYGLLRFDEIIVFSVNRILVRIIGNNTNNKN